MILGIGIDAVNIDRASKLSERTIEKIFHSDEIAEIKRLSESAPLRVSEYIASRFAVKEAYAKACGTGFSVNVVPNEICTVSDEKGKPCIKLYGKTLDSSPCCAIHVSITHEHPLAIAYVVLEEFNGKN